MNETSFSVLAQNEKQSEESSNLPKISFIIPTYNAEKYLKRCLDSIFEQEYPREKYEVIVADGGSSDETLSIVKNYDVVALHNAAKDAESGKFLALEKAAGEVIALVDSDNVLASTDWLRKMVQPLMEDDQLLGVESNYLIADDFTSINTYANLLVIVDPLARMLASRPRLEQRDGYLVKVFQKGSVPVAGANGFLWRRKIIDAHHDQSLRKFSEANFLGEVSRKMEVTYANVPGVGIYHYYCTSFSDYIAKRKKIAGKFLSRKQKREQTWVDKRSRWYFLVCVFYLATIVGPLTEAMANFLKERRREWFWHPIISTSTILIYIYQWTQLRN